MRGLLTAIVVALLASGVTVPADAQDAPPEDKAADPVTTTAQQRDRAFEVERSIRKNLITLRLADCEPSDAAACDLKAVNLANFTTRGDCARYVVSENAVILPDGTRKQAVFTDMFLVPEDGDAPALKRNKWIKAVELFDDDGLQPACRRIEIEGATFAVADKEGDQLGAIFFQNWQIGSLLGGLAGGQRSFIEQAGCLLTGCEERNSVAVSIKGGARPLRIFLSGAPTGITTDQTINVSLTRLERLSVSYPDGSIQPVSKCKLLAKQRFSLSYDCGTPNRDRGRKR